MALAFEGTVCASVMWGDTPVVSGEEGASDPPVFDGVAEFVDARRGAQGEA